MILITDKKYNENEVLLLVSQGDEVAFRELFEHYQNKLYSVALRITRSSTLSEEIVEDVFLKIWLKRNDLLEIQNFSAYLFVITRNRVYKTLKQIAKSYETVVLTEDNKIAANENIEDYLINKEYSTVLHEAVTRLPQKQKEVYSLIKEHGLKRDEAAYVLNLKPETIKSHLAEAMKNIRSYCTLYLDMMLLIPVYVFYFTA
ncbi:MAG: RNA polymerase sigma factor [Ginsengibacter sp.]